MQPPEIEVRLHPSFRHSGQGWECLKVTQRRSQPYRRKQSIGRGTLREKLVKIGAKLGIPFWDYLGGRLKGPDAPAVR